MQDRPDSVRELVKSRLKELGLSMSDASKRVNKNHAYLQQFITRSIPIALPEDVRVPLAAVLGVSEADLRDRRDGAHSGLFEKDSNVRDPRALSNVNRSDLIPVLGSAAAGTSGAFLFNGDVVDRVQRPPSLVNAVNGYALFVTGELMEPRYSEGELVYIHPAKPVTLGCYVVVQTRNPDGSAAPLGFLRRLSKRTAKVITLEQFNPKKTTDIQVSDVIAMHRVTGSGDA